MRSSNGRRSRCRRISTLACMNSSSPCPRPEPVKFRGGVCRNGNGQSFQPKMRLIKGGRLDEHMLKLIRYWDRSRPRRLGVTLSMNIYYLWLPGLGRRSRLSPPSIDRAMSTTAWRFYDNSRTLAFGPSSMPPRWTEAGTSKF